MMYHRIVLLRWIFQGRLEVVLSEAVPASMPRGNLPQLSVLSQVLAEERGEFSMIPIFGPYVASVTTVWLQLMPGGVSLAILMTNLVVMWVTSAIPVCQVLTPRCALQRMWRRLCKVALVKLARQLAHSRAGHL